VGDHDDDDDDDGRDLIQRLAAVTLGNPDKMMKTRPRA